MIGYHSINREGVVWRDNQGALIPITMPHAIPALSPASGKNLLKESGAWLIRWDQGFTATSKSPWWHIIKDTEEALDELSASTRSKVRRGMKAFDCIPCSIEEIISEGYHVYVAAFQRYQTHEKCYDHSEFIAALRELPDETQFWSVKDKKTGRMVAFSENIVRDNACLYNTIWFEPAALKKYSSYALFHVMNEYYLNHKKLRYVSDGARNISHQTGIHEFLQEKFGFRKAYAVLHVEYSALLDVMIKLCYPFRTVFSHLPGRQFQKVDILLRQEVIHRACRKMVIPQP
jgi:hypothetical protein